MGFYQISHSFMGISGEGDDRYTNVWHVEVSDLLGDPEAPGAVEVWDEIRDWIHSFYQGHAVSSVDNPSYYYSKAVQNPGWSLKVIDAFATPPVHPVYESVSVANPFATVASAPPLPPEVALCLSYEAIISSGDLAGRRRNRLYFGPFNQAAEEADGSEQQSRPSELLRDALVREFIALNTNLEGMDIPGSLRVWSKTESEFFTPHKVWVDNAWDTQRRRGSLATGRSTGVFA